MKTIMKVGRKFVCVECFNKDKELNKGRAGRNVGWRPYPVVSNKNCCKCKEKGFFEENSKH